MQKIVKWINDEELKSIYTSKYWNDLELEKNKKGAAWWIKDGNYDKCLKHLNTSLMGEFESAKNYIYNINNDKIKVVDLAAGIGWTSVLLSKINKVEEIHAVEISKHRLDFLFEECVKMLSGKGDKIFRYLGSFYDLKFDNNSMDLIFMSQAFHHANAPLKLLLECDRVLKNNGRIILIGEQYIGLKRVIVHFLSYIKRKRKVSFNFYELFQPDHILGDHLYRVSDYMFMFNSLGYSLNSVKLKNGNIMYIADKNY